MINDVGKKAIALDNEYMFGYMVMISGNWKVPVEKWTKLQAFLSTNPYHSQHDYIPFVPLTYCHVPVINYMIAKNTQMKDVISINLV